MEETLSLTREEREELTNLYAELQRGGKAFNPSEEERKEGEIMLHTALWSAMCHTTGRCGMAVNLAYPDTPQARLYELMMKALQD
jgi:hypothetical protein